MLAVSIVDFGPCHISHSSTLCPDVYANIISTGILSRTLHSTTLQCSDILGAIPYRLQNLYSQTRYARPVHMSDTEIYQIHQQILLGGFSAGKGAACATVTPSSAPRATTRIVIPITNNFLNLLSFRC